TSASASAETFLPLVARGFPLVALALRAAAPPPLVVRRTVGAGLPPAPAAFFAGVAVLPLVPDPVLPLVPDPVLAGVVPLAGGLAVPAAGCLPPPEPKAFGGAPGLAFGGAPGLAFGGSPPISRSTGAPTGVTIPVRNMNSCVPIL